MGFVGTYVPNQSHSDHQYDFMSKSAHIPNPNQPTTTSHIPWPRIYSFGPLRSSGLVEKKTSLGKPLGKCYKNQPSLLKQNKQKLNHNKKKMAEYLVAAKVSVDMIKIISKMVCDDRTKVRKMCHASGAFASGHDEHTVLSYWEGNWIGSKSDWKRAMREESSQGKVGSVVAGFAWGKVKGYC
jgi:hypothetical protein